VGQDFILLADFQSAFFLSDRVWHFTCLFRFDMLPPIANRLELYMDLLSARQRLVASNIANAATPGYKTKDVDFHFEFQSAIQDLRIASKPDVVEVPGLKTRNDGNNVGLDRESRLLSENAMRFNIASNLWKAQYRQLRSAVLEGKNG